MILDLVLAGIWITAIVNLAVTTVEDEEFWDD